MTATSLADILSVSPATISSYEHDRQKPPVEMIERLASNLNVAASFFASEIPTLSGEGFFFRSMNYATKAARTRARRRYEWLQENVIYLAEYFDFPSLNIPDFGGSLDYRRIDTDQIDEAASICRKHWGVNGGPCPNLVRLAESKGILVSRGKLDAEGLDAFSHWSDIGRPFIFLGSDKASAARSRFDIAHEIGHLVLHQRVDHSALASPKDYKIIENQANRFASVFLLPAKEFTTELSAPTLDSFRLLKAEWKVSIGAMIMRSRDLKLIDEEQSKRLWINMNRRGWRTNEPLDDIIEPEKPSLLSQCVEMMVNEQFKSKEEIVADLMLSANDIEELCGLGRGYLSANNIELMPRPKFGSGANDNILPFKSL